MWNSNRRSDFKSSGNTPNKTHLYFSSLYSNSVSLSITSRAVNTTDDMFTSLLSMLRCFCAGQQSFILTCVGVTCTLRRQRRTCRVDWMFLLNVLPQVITVESVWIGGGGEFLVNKPVNVRKKMQSMHQVSLLTCCLQAWRR